VCYGLLVAKATEEEDRDRFEASLTSDDGDVLDIDDEELNVRARAIVTGVLG
jgi:hypothetical protein